MVGPAFATLIISIIYVYILFLKSSKILNVRIRDFLPIKRMVYKYMDEITVSEKLPENDQPIIIEEDVWCGANVTLLKGVNIGKGSVIAAGAVVTANVGEYEIWGGIPAKMLRKRFE